MLAHCLQAGRDEAARELGPKGSDAHKAAVVGDTVGDVSAPACCSATMFRSLWGLKASQAMSVEDWYCPLHHTKHHMKWTNQSCSRLIS